MQSIKGLPVGTVNTVTEKTATKPQSVVLDLPRGMDLLNHQLLNKSTAFTEEERSKFGLHGLLPPHVESLEEQVVRAYEAYKRKGDASSDTSICAHCRIPMKSFFTDFYSTTLKR